MAAALLYFLGIVMLVVTLFSTVIGLAGLGFAYREVEPSASLYFQVVLVYSVLPLVITGLLFYFGIRAGVKKRSEKER